MFDPIETFEHEGYTIEIHHDFDCGHESPREWGNLGTLAIMGYGGDEKPDRDNEPDPRHFIVLPVYRYEHSGVAYNTTGFHCPWDSGQTGYIYVSKAKVRDEWGVKRISPQLREKVEGILRSEVEVFSQWANGEVYGFITKDEDGEEIDSCWGMYDDSVNFDYIRSAAVENI